MIYIIIIVAVYMNMVQFGTLQSSMGYLCTVPSGNNFIWQSVVFTLEWFSNFVVSMGGSTDDITISANSLV
ncbi:hypothetical protein BDW42DRAFT_175955, partial [Aspergillus taichungensis]